MEELAFEFQARGILSHVLVPVDGPVLQLPKEGVAVQVSKAFPCWQEFVVLIGA